MSENNDIYITQEPNQLTMRFPSVMEHVNQAEASTREFLQMSGVAPEDIFSTCLVMREALVNAVSHGNRFDPDKRVQYALRWQDDILTMEIEDQGDGFDWRAIANEPPPIDADHGRGIFIMRRYFSDYQYNDIGNRLILTKYCPRIQQAESDRQAFLKELEQSVLKSPELIKDISDDDIFKLIEYLYMQRNKVELINAEMRRAVNWSSRLGSPGQSDQADAADSAEETATSIEERYRALFESNPLEIITVDKQGRITEYNLAKKEAGGRLPEIGAIMYKDYAADHAGDMYGELMQCIRTGQPKEFPGLSYKDKTLQIRISPFSEGAVITSVNMTHVRQTEKKLAHFVSAIEQTREEVVIINLDGSLEYANEAFLHRHSSNLETIVGRNVFEDGLHLYNKAHFEEIWNTLKKGRPWTGTFSRICAGAQHEVSSTISPVRDTTGAVICYVSVTHDLTREAQLEDQLRHARKMQLIGTIAGGIAHDFSNLLSAIMMNAELLVVETPEDSEARDCAEQIRLASHRARMLTNHILLFSRDDTTEKMPLAVAPLVRETLKTLGTITPRNITISQYVPEEAGFVVGNPMQIQEMIMNLSDNAIAAMRDGGGVLTVSVSRVTVKEDANTADVPAGNYIKLSVRDTGHGIPSGSHKQIFEPFFTLSETGQSAGLGLFVTQGIVTGHSGVITVDSEEGQWTEFNVFFPEVALPDQKMRQDQKTPLPRGQETLLLVDDDVQAAVVGEKILSHLGYTTVTVNSAEEAVALVKENPERFDLIITDMTMPRLTGLDLAREMTSIKPDLPIILCTGYNQMITPEKAKALGIRKFLMKPLEMKKMAHAIRSVLENR